jgi:hypothetical protein
VSEIEKASAAAVDAARQSDQYAALLATVQAEAANRQQPLPIVHIHQAAPDRTVQRVALGAGIGGGAVAGAVYFGPLLVASLWSIAIVFAVGGLVLAVIVRGITAILGGAQQPKGKRRR